MLLSSVQKTKLPLVLVIIGVLAFGSFCVGMIRHDSTQNHMNSAEIVQTNSQKECCKTGISNHVESWKSLILKTSRDMRDLLLLLVVGLVMAFSFGNLRPRPNLLSYHLYIRDNPNLSLFNNLKLAFARGILNPKVY